MIDNLIEDLYCRLYIHSNDDEDSLRKRIAEYIDGIISMREISNDYLYMSLSKSDVFSAKLINMPNGFINYKYMATVHPWHEIYEEYPSVDQNKYIDILCYIITEMRKYGYLVVASCEYEDIIVKKTGWNWSRDNPYHPKFISS